MPNDLDELRHQERAGEGIAVTERKRAKKSLQIRNGSIIIEGDIPARITGYNEEWVCLRFAGGKEKTVKRDWIEGRFQYSKKGGLSVE